MKWLINKYPTNENTLVLYDCIFANICDHGDLHVVKWLDQVYETKSVDSRRNRNQLAFTLACEYGNLPVVKWLLNTYNNDCVLTSTSISGTFDLVCRNGHLSVAKLLAKTCPHINPRHNDSSTFYWSCFHGRLEVVKWLVMTFPDIVDFYSFSKACRYACNGHQQHVVKWLVMFDRQTRYMDNASLCDEIFWLTCLAGNIELAKWFFQTFPHVNIQKTKNKIRCYVNSRSYIYKWLETIESSQK